MPKLSLTLLGGFRARSNGRNLTIATKKGQALLAYLALCPDGQPRDKLATLLWAETDDNQARHSLRQTLFELRQALPTGSPPCLVVDGESVCLAREAVDVDVSTFERLAVEATPQALERAADLYRGDLLEGFSVSVEPFDEWLRMERERLRERALHTLMRLFDHLVQGDDLAHAIDTAIRVLALDPLQEPAHRALMGLFLRQGRRGAALHQYQICVELLQRELGVEPEPETTEIYRRILAGSRSGAPRAARVLRRARARREVLGRIASTPFVGRAAEVAQLREALERARRGHGQVVAILGEAGVGKTRLVEELQSRAGRCRVPVLLGRCYESERVLPFGPWIEALRGSAVAARSLAALPAIWRAELARLLPDLREEGWPTAEDPSGHRRLFEAVARLVEHLSMRKPLVLVVEDLHWADEMSLRLLAFLGRRLAEWPVLLLATAREEDLTDPDGPGHAFGELRRDGKLVQVSLSPLSPDNTVALVRALAGAGLDHAEVARLADQIWRTSEGNPFVIVESVRALQETKHLDTSGPLVLPEKVREIVAGRLTRLSDRSQQLVAVAAVIGREFEFSLLQRAAGLGVDQAAAGVEELVRRRVFRRLDRGFDFTHARIREVAHGQLLAPRRRILHEQVAGALEATYAGRLEPHFKALGHHCWESEQWSKAAGYLRRAGAVAYVLAAHRPAVACFEQALAAVECLPRTPETIAEAIDLRLDIRRALTFVPDWERCVDILLAAEALAREIGDERRRGFACSFLCTGYRVLGDYASAIEMGERALAVGVELGDLTLEVETLHHLGQVYMQQGEYRRARGLLTRVMEVLKEDRRREQAGVPPRFGSDRAWLVGGRPQVLVAATGSLWLALSLSELGELGEALVCGENRVRDVESVEDRDALTTTLAHLTVGAVRLSKGDFDAAIDSLERSLAACREGDIGGYRFAVLARLGYACALAGRVADALPLAEHALRLAESAKHQSGLSRWNALLSEVYLLASRPDQALPLAQTALALARRQGERGFEAWALRLLGEIHSHPDRLGAEQATASYRRAMALADELSMRPLLAHCHFGVGKLYRRTGERQDARQHLVTATKMFHEMDMPYWVERARAEADGPA